MWEPLGLLISFLDLVIVCVYKRHRPAQTADSLSSLGPANFAGQNCTNNWKNVPRDNISLRCSPLYHITLGRGTQHGPCHPPPPHDTPDRSCRLCWLAPWYRGVSPHTPWPELPPKTPRNLLATCYRTINHPQSLLKGTAAQANWTKAKLKVRARRVVS